MEVRRLDSDQSRLARRRLAYTLAAGAASMGFCESEARAVISYSGIQNLAINQGSFQDLNIDGDKNSDIRLKNYAYTNGINYQGATVSFFPGKIVGFQTNNLYYVKALHAGDPINSSTVGPTFYGSMALGNATVNQNLNAQFTNVTNAYIGLDFRINNGADLYYGWVRVTVNNATGTFIIGDWAYNKVPGAEILAGDTGVTPVPGDFNSDGKVDASDYVVWRDNQNSNQPLPNDNGLGTPIGANHYALWRANFGSGTGSGSGLENASVPEPITLGLLATGAVGVGLLRRSRRGHA